MADTPTVLNEPSAAPAATPPAATPTVPETPKAPETPVAPNPYTPPAKPEGEKPAEKTGEQEQKTDEKTDGKADESNKSDVPEKYELTIPEDIQVNKDLLTKFTDFAKSKGWSKDDAQAVADMQVELARQQATDTAKAWEGTLKEWREAATADKEYGGANFNESIAAAKGFLDAFGTPELKEALDQTGMGNHPELIRAFVKAGKALKEDSFKVGSSVSSAPKTLADVLYPNQNKK